MYSVSIPTLQAWGAAFFFGRLTGKERGRDGRILQSEQFGCLVLLFGFSIGSPFNWAKVDIAVKSVGIFGLTGYVVSGWASYNSATAANSLFDIGKTNFNLGTGIGTANFKSGFDLGIDILHGFSVVYKM